MPCTLWSLPPRSSPFIDGIVDIDVDVSRSDWSMKSGGISRILLRLHKS